MRKFKLTMTLSWYYILAFFLLFGLISYFYRSFRIKEGAGAKKKFDREIWYGDDSDNGKYYDGRITKRNRDGTYDVEYIDRDTAKNIDADWIEPNPENEVSSPDTKSPAIKYIKNTNPENDEVLRKEYTNLDSCEYLYIKDYVLNGSCKRLNDSFCPSKSYNIKNCPGKNIINCNGAFVCDECEGDESEPCGRIPKNRFYSEVISPTVTDKYMEETNKYMKECKIAGGKWEKEKTRCNFILY